MNGNEKRKKPLYRLSYLLNFLLIAALALLIRQNILLRKALVSRMPPMPSVTALKPGEHVKPFKVRALDGTEDVIHYSDTAKNYVLCVFSTSCSHCEKTSPLWQMIENNRSNNWEVIGISLQGEEETKIFEMIEMWKNNVCTYEIKCYTLEWWKTLEKRWLHKLSNLQTVGYTWDIQMRICCR